VKSSEINMSISKTFGFVDKQVGLLINLSVGGDFWLMGNG
jgi:hypothetical protein